METIELKPKRLNLALRVFVVAFLWMFLLKLWQFGLFEKSEMWLVIRARAIEAFVATCVFSIFPLKYRNIELTGTTLQAPMKKKRVGLWKSKIVNLSEVNVSHAFIDRICGARLATTDGMLIDINPFFYPIGTIPKLLEEIELRQKNDPTIKG